MIADQLGRSRVSMTQGRLPRAAVVNAGNLAALESYGPSPKTRGRKGREAFVPAFVPLRADLTRLRPGE
jgi:hypothetical protein